MVVACKQNFGQETRETLALYGYQEKDIDWIGDSVGKYGVEVEEFFRAADSFDYNAGWGIPFVPVDLIIMFKDGCYLCRQEYDGSEWWYLQVNKKKPRFIFDGLDFSREEGGYLPTFAGKLGVK